MKFKNFLPVLLVLISLVFISASCDDDDYITVSSTELSLTREQNSSTNLKISSNVQWTASISYEGAQTGWLNISTTMGNKCDDLPVTITATSENHDNSDRVAKIYFTAGDASAIVSVIQKGYNADSNLDITIKDVVTLTTSVACKHSFGSKVSYYYSGYLNSAAAGWTDEKIANELASNFDAKNPDDEVVACDGLQANTSYILCAVGFDALGNMGRVMKEPVKTAAVVNNRPNVLIDNISVKYDNGTSYWYWETTVGAFCDKYYMIAKSGNTAYVYGNLCDAIVAWFIKDGIKSGDVEPVLKSSTWQWNRSTNDIYFYCAAWAVGEGNKFAGELDKKFGRLSSSAKNRVESSMKKETIYKANYAEFKKDMKVYYSK